MNPACRLQEIKEEIKELVDETKRLIKFHGKTIDFERAKSYWIPQILTALDKDHEYLGSSMFTMQDSIDAIDTGEDEEEAEG
jgi:hypothetical protein